MSDKRTERLAGEFRRIISDIIHSELKDPRLTGMSSIVDVMLTRDLNHAKIRVSVMGSPEEKKSAMAVLLSASGFIRSKLAARVRVRRVPELHFVLDDSIEYSIHISRLLESVAKEKTEEKNE
ncbi:MAG: 30S ribosome-binding factor RbfA [Bacillota bacterium]|nr:30S ribosome-binding factor RbfA [Bacillota bacterium]